MPAAGAWRMLAAGSDYWVYTGLTDAYVYDGLGHGDITPTVPFTGDANNQWNGGSLAGVLVVTNGKDAPHYWPIGGGDMVILPFSPGNSWAAEGITAKIVRPFRNFLVALDITRGGTNYPQLVKWSHPADPGTVPVSWDETDTMLDTGEAPLSEVDGELIDCLPLQDVNMIYKENSTTRMQFIGGVFVFSFRTVFQTLGAIGQNCAVNIPEARQAVLGTEDIVVHNGQQAQSIADSRVRKNLFSSIASDVYKNAFVTTNPAFQEVWFCYPESGHTYPNVAWVWNWGTGAWSKRALGHPVILVPRSTNLTPTSLVWDGAVARWEESFKVWDVVESSRPSINIFGAYPLDTKLKMPDNPIEAPIGSWVERQGIGIPIKSGEAPDISLRKFMRAVWPRINGATGAWIRIHVGYQENVNTPAVYTEIVDFQIGVDVKVDCRVSGRMFALKFESITNAAWKLYGYDLEVEISGRY